MNAFAPEPSVIWEPATVDPNAKPSWWTSDEWSTPPKFFEQVNRLFGPFDLDPCCRPETAKAPKFHTEVDNGLIQPWNGKVWVNPPYSDPRPWVMKACEEQYHNSDCKLIVMLLPAAIDTKWFHLYVKNQALFMPVYGRIKFHGWHNKPVGSPKAGNLLALYTPPGFPCAA